MPQIPAQVSSPAFPVQKLIYYIQIPNPASDLEMVWDLGVRYIGEMAGMDWYLGVRILIWREGSSGPEQSKGFMPLCPRKRRVQRGRAEAGEEPART